MADATTYVPTAEDFEFLTGRDITVDKNFASLSYWKGVAIHFFRNRRAVAGLIIVAVLIVAMTISVFIQPPVYSTDILLSAEDPSEGVVFDNTYTAHFTDDSFGTLSIRYEDAIECYMVHAELRKQGKAEVVLESPDGEVARYDIEIGSSTYEITPKN